MKASPGVGRMSAGDSRVRGVENVIAEYEGLRLIPPLVRTAQGWAERRSSECSCGGRRFLVGWTACSCRTDTLGPGHRTWECQQCGRRAVLGCLEAPVMGPLDEYGCAERRGSLRDR
ncbi:hypothetical protein GCM10028787_32460 [Brachybacterium horti]